MNFIFFLKGPFSQWAKSPFTDKDGIQFQTAEQYMMYKKAILFGDTTTARLILGTSSPKGAQALGRVVANFDQKKWDEVKWQIVYDGNYYKFTQNNEYKDLLLSKEDGSIFVETNPEDRIWGIGLSEEEAKITPPTKWRGQNLLGQILTLVRSKLKEEGI